MSDTEQKIEAAAQDVEKGVSWVKAHHVLLMCLASALAGAILEHFAKL